MPLLEDLYQKQRARQVELLPFFYSTAFLASAVAAGATVSQSININSDSHFIVRYFNITAYTAGLVVAVATPPLLIQFQDTGSGRTVFDNPQPIQNVCGGVAAAAGTGSLPFILPEPWLIRAGSLATVTLVNLGAAAFVRVDVSLPGFKAFRFGATTPADL
jgi:hypothetical protein